MLRWLAGICYVFASTAAYAEGEAFEARIRIESRRRGAEATHEVRLPGRVGQPWRTEIPGVDGVRYRLEVKEGPKAETRTFVVECELVDGERGDAILAMPRIVVEEGLPASIECGLGDDRLKLGVTIDAE